MVGQEAVGCWQKTSPSWWGHQWGGMLPCVVQDLNLFLCRTASLSVLELRQALGRAASWCCKVR